MKKHKYTWKRFDKDVDNLIRRLKYAKFKPKTIISVATGGLPFGTKLKNKLETPLVIISAVSYKGQTRGTLAFNTSFTKPLKSPVLIVDDICDSGETMYNIYNYITSMGIIAKTATLFYKERSVFKPDWYFNKVEDPTWIVFPWE